jgi:hypothetical protein
VQVLKLENGHQYSTPRFFTKLSSKLNARVANLQHCRVQPLANFNSQHMQEHVGKIKLADKLKEICYRNNLYILRLAVQKHSNILFETDLKKVSQT